MVEPGSAEALGRAAAAWAGSRRISVSGVPVRYREAGEGPVVVLVHGLAMMSDYWMRAGPSLAAAGYRVIAPDLPGFGRSPGPRDGLPVPEQVAWVARWADAMDLPSAVYLGHSLSCQTVLELAVHSPERVKGLVLAAPSGKGGPWQMAREAFTLFLDAWRENVSFLVLAAHSYLRAGPIRFVGTWKRGEEHDPLPLLPHVHVPVLVVVGDRDPVVPEEFAGTIAAGLPAGRLAVIAGEAHAISQHEPELFNAAVISFLRECF